MSTDIKVEGPTAGFEAALKAKGVPAPIIVALRGELTKYLNVTKYGYAASPTSATELAISNAYGLDISRSQAGQEVIAVVANYMRKAHG
jgi:hypothetical protein